MDLIVEVDRHLVKTTEDLKRGLNKHPANSPLLLLVHRNGESFYVTLAS